MSSCYVYRASVPDFIDAELSPGHRNDFLAHVEHCASCRASLAEEQALSARIKAARPQIAAPAYLRAALEQRIQDVDAASSGRAVVRPSPRAPRWWHQAVAAAAVLLSLSGSALFFYEHQHRSSKAVIQAAMQGHQLLSDHAVSLDITSESPEVVSSWFASKLSFPFHMANAGIAANNRAKYQLDGGRIVIVGSERVALVSFHIPHEQVSMLVVPQHMLIASGGKLVVSDGIALHSRDLGSVHIVTWNNRGLAYVLSASSFMGNPHTCNTCHQMTPTQQSAQSSVSNAQRVQGDKGGEDHFFASGLSPKRTESRRTPLPYDLATIWNIP